MSLDRATWPLIIVAALIGAVALATGSTAERVLGGLALAVAAGLAWTALRDRRGRDVEQQEAELDIRTPDLSVGERLLPWIFFGAAILIVVAMTAFTLWYIGLR